MTTQTQSHTPKSHPKSSLSLRTWVLLMTLFLTVALLAVVWWSLNQHSQPEVNAVSREGVVTQIQQLHHLQTVAFNVDTVITSEKQGNWYNLWQDQQSGLFIAQGRVVAGIDLSKLTPEMIEVTPKSERISNEYDVHINIQLPASELFSVSLDNVEVYNWKTGLFGMLQVDPNILNQAQVSGKAQVLERACAGNVMQMAADNAAVQVQRLFGLTGASVTVTASPAGACRL